MNESRQGIPMVRVWDLPTRLFHWLLVFAFAVAWISSEEETWLGIHVLAGSVMLGLIAFRLVWGLVGTHHARFTDFVKPPREVMAYLQGVMWGNAPRVLGHNPAGGYGIVALMGLTVLVGVLGVLTLGTQEGHGPMAGWLPRRWGEGVEDLHEGAAMLLLAMVGIHLCGVLVESLLHRENLVASMIHGLKRAEGANPPPAVGRHLPVALLLVVGVGLGALLLFQERAGGTEGLPRIFAAQPLPMDGMWRKECGSCHLEYHPSLLPERSWQAMLRGQEDHFGEDLGLSAQASERLLEFARAHSAEHEQSEAAVKMVKGIPADGAPQRITETPYWKKKHHEIDNAVFRNPKVGGKLRCENCHLDARHATFEDEAVRVPVSLKH